MSQGVSLWRVSNYATLDGSGGMYAAGRWHSKGRPVIYCSEDPSTALLEILVHIEIDPEDRPQSFQVLKIESAASVSIEPVDLKHLGNDWQNDLNRSRSTGDEWLRSRRTLLLEVPSVLVSERRNYVVNPMHFQMKELRIAARYSYPFDPRFFR